MPIADQYDVIWSSLLSEFRVRNIRSRVGDEIRNDPKVLSEYRKRMENRFGTPSSKHDWANVIMGTYESLNLANAALQKLQEEGQDNPFLNL
jgi:hypothetical protein